MLIIIEMQMQFSVKIICLYAWVCLNKQILHVRNRIIIVGTRQILTINMTHSRQTVWAKKFEENISWSEFKLYSGFICYQFTIINKNIITFPF